MEKIISYLKEKILYRSYYALLTIIVVFISVFYIKMEMNDSNFIFDFFQKVYYMPFKFTLIFILIFSIIGFIGNSRYVFILNIVTLLISILFYVSQWLLIIVLIGLSYLAYYDINKKRKSFKDQEYYQVIDAYFVEKTGDHKELDKDVIHNIALEHDKNFD